MLQIKNTLGGGGGNAPYAWAKYEKVVITNPTFTFNCPSRSNTLTITASSFDLSLITSSNYIEFFNTFADSSGSKSFDIRNGDLYFYDSKINGYSNGSFTWNTTFNTSYTLEMSRPTDYIVSNSFIEYVTDKSPTKYPNGEVHTDGYFYRYAPEGLYAWTKNEIGSELKEFNKSVSTLPYEFYEGCAVIYNGEIHILGGNGNNTNHYKWDGSSWASVSTLPYNFVNGCAVVLNNEIHILGSSDYRGYKSHYKWDGTSWSSVSTLPYNFCNGCAVVLDNEIHILGSNSSSTYKEHYKWNGSSWTSVSTLPYNFYNGSAVVLDGEIHIFSSTSNSSHFKSHYKWDGGSWTSVSTLPYSCYYGSAVVFEGKIHIMGGDGSYTGHYRFDGTSWVSVNTLPYSLQLGSAVVCEDGIHILGSNISGDRRKHYLIIGRVPVYTFLDYIVSDKETAFPDGGEKDGHWYERVADGITPEMFGCTKFAIDEFVVASRTSTSSFASNISHSLGEVPKVAIISLIDNLSSLTNNDVFFLMRFQDAFEGSNSYHLEGYNDGTANMVTQMSSGYGTYIDTMTNNNVPLNCPSSSYYWQYFAVGTYKVITMA